MFYLSCKTLAAFKQKDFPIKIRTNDKIATKIVMPKQKVELRTEFVVFRPTTVSDWFKFEKFSKH